MFPIRRVVLRLIRPNPLEPVSTYEVLRRFAAAAGAGVLGENTVGSGTAIGVEGAVPNSDDGFGLSTPDDVRIGGDIDTDATNFTVPARTTGTVDAQNVVLGHEENEVLDGAVGATIGGGGYFDGGDPATRVADDDGTIAGGFDNVVGIAKIG